MDSSTAEQQKEAESGEKATCPGGQVIRVAPFLSMVAPPFRGSSNQVGRSIRLHKS